MDAQDKAPANPAPQPLVAAFGELPGEFAIRTGLKNTFLTARDGGRHSIDAVITAATAIGANEKFKLTSFQPDFTTIQTLLWVLRFSSGRRRTWREPRSHANPSNGEDGCRGRCPIQVDRSLWRR